MLWLLWFVAHLRIVKLIDSVCKFSLCSNICKRLINGNLYVDMLHLIQMHTQKKCENSPPTLDNNINILMKTQSASQSSVCLHCHWVSCLSVWIVSSSVAETDWLGTCYLVKLQQQQLQKKKKKAVAPWHNYHVNEHVFCLHFYDVFGSSSLSNLLLHILQSISVYVSRSPILVPDNYSRLTKHSLSDPWPRQSL